MKYIEAATYNTTNTTYWTEKPFGSKAQVAKMVAEGVLKTRKVLVVYPTRREAVEYIAAAKAEA